MLRHALKNFPAGFGPVKNNFEEFLIKHDEIKLSLVATKIGGEILIVKKKHKHLFKCIQR